MDWYERTDATGAIYRKWFASRDDSFTDMDGNKWSNIGENFLSLDGNNAILYTQYVDEQGRLCLRNTTYNLADEESAKELESVLGGLVGSGASVAGVVGESMKGSRATFRLTNSKGKIDIHICKKGWWGNQYVTPTAVSKLGKIVSRAGQIAGIAEILVSLNSYGHATTPEEKAEHSLDMLMGAASFLPKVGTAISFCWTFGGKKIYSMWINEGLIPQIERGENPGAMINQPFK
ncbi:hypothetical protein SAMN06298215_1699 [Bacteroidales bacterium WCE2008]|nr:hypothetical protein SAMN06298215_1699 [Bacteroidales bacterium WCE2008]